MYFNRNCWWWKAPQKRILFQLFQAHELFSSISFPGNVFPCYIKKQWKNNDGEREITEMKMKTNFHSVPLWVALKYYTENCAKKRHTRAVSKRNSAIFSFLRQKCVLIPFNRKRSQERGGVKNFSHSNDPTSLCMWNHFETFLCRLPSICYFQFAQVKISPLILLHIFIVVLRELYHDIEMFYHRRTLLRDDFPENFPIQLWS